MQNQAFATVSMNVFTLQRPTYNPYQYFQATTTNAVINLHDDDDDHDLYKNEQEDTALSPTYLQEWDDFCNEFANSTTYTLEHSSTASLMPSPIIDDDNDN